MIGGNVFKLTFFLMNTKYSKQSQHLGNLIFQRNVKLVHEVHNSSSCTWKADAITCNISSQSSLPTKIISLGSLWRVPPLLTKNQDVKLIFCLADKPLAKLRHPAARKRHREIILVIFSYSYCSANTVSRIQKASENTAFSIACTESSHHRKRQAPDLESEVLLNETRQI